jgi:hypothetical protein
VFSPQDVFVPQRDSGDDLPRLFLNPHTGNLPSLQSVVLLI